MNVSVIMIPITITTSNVEKRLASLAALSLSFYLNRTIGHAMGMGCKRAIKVIKLEKLVAFNSLSRFHTLVQQTLFFLGYNEMHPPLTIC